MITADKATLEHIKDRNRIFFSKESVGFHGDRKYKLEHEDGKTFLVVTTGRNKVWYEVGHMTLKLNYFKQQ